MKIKTVLMLVVAAGLLGLAALFLSRPTATPPAGLAEWNAPFLKDVNLAGLATVSVSNSHQTVTLSLSNGSWRVQNRYAYPADLPKLRAFLDNLRTTTLVEAIDSEPGDQSDLGLDADQGTRLALSDNVGKRLLAITAGHVHQKKSDDPSLSMFGGFPDGRYVLLDRSVYLISNTLDELDDGPALWLDTEFLRVPPDDLSSLSLAGPGREPLHLARATPTAEWQLDRMPVGKVLDAERLTRLTSVFDSLSIADLADPALPDSTTGFSTGTVCTATATNGVVYTLHLGNTEGAENRRYARLSIQGQEPLPESATHQAARFASWIFLFDAYATEPLYFLKEQLTAEPSEPHTPELTNSL